MARIVLIQAHPDPAPERFCRALARAYTEGATRSGHELRSIDLATLDIPLLRSATEFESGELPASLRAAAADLAWAEHVVIVHPLWLGTMPALLKAFLEQVFRPGVAFRYRAKGMPEKLFAGKSARLIVTMGMPAPLYRWFYRAHGVQGLARSILAFSGISPVRKTLIGMVASKDPEHNQRWLERVRGLGEGAR